MTSARAGNAGATAIFGGVGGAAGVSTTGTDATGRAVVRSTAMGVSTGAGCTTGAGCGGLRSGGALRAGVRGTKAAGRSGSTSTIVTFKGLGNSTGTRCDA